MKKFLISVGMMLVGMAVLQAEQLSFVTVMSAPVGSFAQVETQGQASVDNLDLHKGAVTLKGTQSAKLGKVTLDDSTLGGDVTQFKTNTLNLKKNGTIKGGSLIADTLTINQNTNAIILGTLSSDATITTMAAKTRNLNINNGDSKITYRAVDAVFDWTQNTKTPGLSYNGNSNVKLLKGKKSNPTRCLVVKNLCEEIGNYQDENSRCQIKKGRPVRTSDPDHKIGCQKGIAKLDYGTDNDNYTCNETVQPIPSGCVPGEPCDTCSEGITYIDTSTVAAGCGIEPKSGGATYADWRIRKATYRCELQYNRTEGCVINESIPSPDADSCGEWKRTTCKLYYPEDEWCLKS